MERGKAGLIAVAAMITVSGCATAVVAKSTSAPSAPVASATPVAVPTQSPGSSARPTPRPTATSVPKAWWPKRTGEVIYLTFDDGPWPTTHEVLDVLRDNDARATFFQIGRMVDDYGSITPRILAEGHAIGNHTYDHVFLNKLNEDRVRYQLEKSWRTIGYAAQGPCMRPPYGAAGSKERKIATNMGMTPVFWTIDTRDWAKTSEDSIYKQILTAKGGSIVLMHDGGGDRTRTTAALRRALPVLKKKGYRFEAVPVCLRS